MNRAVRGLAFIAAALAHVALVLLLMAPVPQHLSDVADDTRMVVVFIEQSSHGVSSEPSQSIAPLLTLHAPAGDPAPSASPTDSAIRARSASGAPPIIPAPRIIPAPASTPVPSRRRDRTRIDSTGPTSAPTDAAPETSPTPPRIDWQQETRVAAARMADLLEAQRRRNQKFTPDPRFARAAARPQFGWDRSKTHRVESLPAGGTLIHLNDRCMLVLSGLLLPICKIGRIPARGDLFEHMGEARASDEEP